ncbi:hypothetical protein G1K86_09150 [Tenacibaculum finnmarkense]|nr:hypothetical protein [Tenacibaculum finnmarkense]
MRYLLLILASISLIVVSSCRKDFNTVPNFGELEFSKDTVFLDTIFSNISSTTYTLKVYNRANKAITIPEIKLKNGNTSKYRLNVDGLSGKHFTDIDILAKDSMYIFVENTVDYNSISTPLYTDKLLFDNGNKQQKVPLVTLIQDAHFIFPSKNNSDFKTLTIDGKNTKIACRFLTDDELIFTDKKPYVIYGYATVPSDKTLTINAGTTIYFHKNSGLIIDKKSRLKINGTFDKKVTFQGDKLAHRYRKTPGQWGSIWIRKGSFGNNINHAVIKNGTVGILVDNIEQKNSPTLLIKNTEIYNNSYYGILGRNTHIEAENLVIGNAGKASLACISGGNYNFTHSTFANYWNNSMRQKPTVFIRNYNTFTDDNQTVKTITENLVKANFINCIIEGNNNTELIFDKKEDGIFNYRIENSLIRGASNNVLNFNDATHFKNILLNGNPHFKDIDENDFRIGENSDAINKAKKTSIFNDILNISRKTTPDIGAYQHITFKKNE